MKDIVVIAHNIRSTHNIGAILRTADGFGVKQVFATGYTPYTKQPGDTRLPHIVNKLTKQIDKTALGAQDFVNFKHERSITELITNLKSDDYTLVGLEQNKRSVLLPNYKSPAKIALLLGEEVNGLTPELIELCDELIEIPMHGQKESFNVSVATGITLYALSI